MSFARSNQGIRHDGRYLRIKQVAELVGLSRPTIYNMEKAGTFPKKTPLGRRAVAWRESEITAWMESRQNIEKTEKEKRPGKPPTKKQKPIEPAVAEERSRANRFKPRQLNQLPSCPRLRQ